MSVTSIDVNGNSVTVESRLFIEQSKRAFKLLDDAAEISKDFKEVVEEVADATGLEKKYVSKYFKSKFKAETKEALVVGQLFEKLDDITGV